jgi:pimeloyl-ACP methyl ester carboxylesterase
MVDLPFREHTLKRYIFPAKSDLPPILFFHANGYSARTYCTLFQTWTASGHEVLSIDFIGHGLSSKSRAFSDWFFFRDQVTTLIDAVVAETNRRPFLVGHSLGGASALLAASQRDVLGVAALDPVVLSPLSVYLTCIYDAPLAKAAERRRSDFRNLQIVSRSYRRSPAFKQWDDRVFRDYLDSCFVKKDDGYTLALPPDIEAKIFRSLKPGHWSHYRSLRLPLFIYAAERSSVCPARSARALCSKHRLSEWKLHPSGSHFFPMEDPDQTAEAVLQFLQKVTAAAGK